MGPAPLVQIPRDKFDTATAELVLSMDPSAVEPVIPALLEWMQDMNWPVAGVLQPYFSRVGLPLAPHCRRILEGDDDIWKLNLIVHVVAHSFDLAKVLRPELTRIATHPTASEVIEGVNAEANRLLQNI